MAGSEKYPLPVVGKRTHPLHFRLNPVKAFLLNMADLFPFFQKKDFIRGLVIPQIRPFASSD
jgi:hypothetical protein